LNQHKKSKVHRKKQKKYDKQKEKEEKLAEMQFMKEMAAEEEK
jgi:hypothetical protein